VPPEVAPDVIITSESSDEETPGIAALIPVMLQEFEISGFSDRSSLQEGFEEPDEDVVLSTDTTRWPTSSSGASQVHHKEVWSKMKTPPSVTKSIIEAPVAPMKAKTV